MRSIIIHYAEIGTKKGNRPYFENKLIHNIKKHTGFRPQKYYGRLVINDLVDGEISQIIDKLQKIPGIAYICSASRSDLKLDSIISLAERVIEQGKTFKIVTKRSNKSFPLTSPEINTQVGQFFHDKGFKVNVHDPEQLIFIEITEKDAFVYKEKTTGLGGLPVGTSGKLLSLISGGLDSPVAAFLMMKRGCKVHFIHLHNERAGHYGKIIELLKILSEFQGETELFAIPFNKIQNEIIGSVPRKYRIIIYRRLMLRIAGHVAREISAKGLITGDSVGQVASQTLENLLVIQQASQLPIYSPLIGLNKQEIINFAKKIGTYKTSIKPYSDCCSFLVAEHPETRAQLEEIVSLESNLRIQELIEFGVKSAERTTIM